MVFVKNRIFSLGYFLDKLSEKSLVFDVLGRKNAFLTRKVKFH